AKAFGERGPREVSRGRTLRPGLTKVEVEAGGGENPDALREVAVLGVALAGRGIHDQKRALDGGHRRALHGTSRATSRSSRSFFCLRRGRWSAPARPVSRPRSSACISSTASPQGRL